MSSPTSETLSFDAFCREGRAWNEMVEASDAASAFLTHQWLTVWWRHFGKGMDFAAPVVRSGPTLLAGVPLALRPVRLAGVRLTVAEIVGTSPVLTRGMGLADRADLAVRTDAPESRPALTRALIDLLDTADVLDLKGIDDQSPTATGLAEAAARPSAVRKTRRSESPYVALDGTYQQWLASRSRNFRKQLKKHQRQLQELGTVEAARLGPDDDVEAWMADVVAVNDSSWKAQRGTNLLRHPDIRAFVLELARVLAAEGMLELHVLRVGDRVVTYDLSFAFAGCVQSYNHSFDASFARTSPGTVLTAAAIESAFARGYREYDFLRGDESYKSRWSETARTELRLVLPADRPRARAYAALAIGLKDKLKRQRWLTETVDRVSGLRTRLRHGSSK